MADLWSSISNSINSTPLAQGLANAFQQYGYNRQGGVPIGQGGTANSVLASFAAPFTGTSPAYASETTQLPSSQNKSTYGNVNYTPDPSKNMSTQPGGSSSGGGGGGGSYVAPPPTNNNPSPRQEDPFAYYRKATENAYRDMEKKLDPWREQRENFINEQYNLGLNDINLSKEAGMDSLNRQRQRVEANQVRNLKDLGNAISQSFNTFSNQLGVMGAGDSSASARMLPYALSRMEAQQRGLLTRGASDAYAGIDERESQLNTAVAQELNRLNQSKMQEMGALAEWYDNARFQISQMRGQNVQALAENVLMQALQKANQIDAEFRARENSLRDWATSISQNIGQLRNNLQAVSDPSLLGQLPQFQGVDARVGGYTPMNYSAPTGFGFGRDEEQRVM